MVYFGHYKEGNLNLDKSITLIGINYPVLDGEFRHEIVSFRSDYITLQGFKIINSGADEVRNIGAVRLYDSRFLLSEIIFFKIIILELRFKEAKDV